jgi:hypothetical protein
LRLKDEIFLKPPGWSAAALASSLPFPASACVELRRDRKFSDAPLWCGNEVLLVRDWFYGVLTDAPMPKLKRGLKPKNPEEGKKPGSFWK